MNLRTLALAAICVFIAAFCVWADDADELAKLQGEWDVQSAQEAGKEQTRDEDPKLSVIIKDDRFSLKVEGQPKTLDMKLTLDPSASPKALELISTMIQGVAAKGIYEVDGDVLKVIWARSGMPRPDAFSTRPADGRIFLTLKRRKVDKP